MTAGVILSSLKSEGKDVANSSWKAWLMGGHQCWKVSLKLANLLNISSTAYLYNCLEKKDTLQATKKKAANYII